jgi:hypothetical protein
MGGALGYSADCSTLVVLAGFLAIPQDVLYLSHGCG